MRGHNKKIALISFMAMVCVVWWHCFCGSQIERWFVPSFCVWSVPWFFFVSGVMFRRTVELKSYRKILSSKVRSLLIPYIVWCGIGSIITMAANGGGGIRCIRTIANKDSPLGQFRTLVCPFIVDFYGYYLAV